jgi:hypothetical protein
MMRFTTAAVSGLLLVSAGAQPARADDAATVQALMRAASEKVHSVRMQISSPIGMTGISTVVREPLRMHMEMATGPIKIEMYAADGYFYQRIGDTQWQKRAMPDIASTVGIDFTRLMANSTQFTLGPDVTENGTTYGTLNTVIKTDAIAGAPLPPALTLNCSYDKKTYLTHTCTNALITETFVGYDDPANVVTLPPDLANAVDAGPIVLPGVPAPATTPPPAK